MGARPPHDQGLAAGTEPRKVPAPHPARPKGDRVGAAASPPALGIPVASAMCLLRALARPAETPLCPSPGKGTTLKPPWPLWGKATVLQGWQGQLLPVPKATHGCRLKPHREPTALSPHWAPERWSDPPGLRWLPLLVLCQGETKQPWQQAEPGP